MQTISQISLLEKQDNRFSTNSNGSCAFNVCAPFFWNDLPLFLRKSDGDPKFGGSRGSRRVFSTRDTELENKL